MKSPFHAQLLRLLYAAICLALCLVLPFLTAQIPTIGQMLAPMHIPAFLCGFLCGWPWAVLVGLAAPLLRSFLYGMPPLFPTAAAMSFELAAYGGFSALFYRLFPRRRIFLYPALISAMLAGRAVWGAATWCMLTASGSGFTFSAFLAGAFTNALPGMLCQILLIPPLVMVIPKVSDAA